MPNIKTKDGIEIRGIPQETMSNEALLKQMVSSLRGSSGAGAYDFATVAQTQARPTEMGTSLTGTPEQRAQLAPEPETTFKGITDPIVKELGPVALAGMIGFATGGLPGAAIGISSVALTDIFSPPIAKFLNKKLGTNQIDSKEMVDRAAEALYFEKPDTPMEKLFLAGAKGLKEGVQFLSGASTLKTGANILGAGTKIQQIGQTLAANPLAQTVGSLFSGVGAEGGSQIAEAQEMGPIMSMIMTMGGAMIGDMTGTGIVDLAQKAQKLMVAKNMDMPEATQEVLDLAKGRVDIVRSDFTPATIEGVDARNVREAVRGGTRNLRYPQSQQRDAMVRSLENDFGEASGSVSNKLNAVAEDFFKKRDATLTEFTTNKHEVLNRLSEAGDSVPTPTVNNIIDEQIAKLEKINNPQNDPIELALRGWKERFSDLAENPSDKSLNTLEELRKDIRQTFKGIEGGPRQRGDVVTTSLYDALKDDMAEYIKKADPTGMDYIKWRDADKELAILMKDFKTEGISAIMSNRDTPIGAMRNIIFNSEPDVMKIVYDKLPPGAQDNARGAFISGMVKDSTDLGNLSSNTFARKLDDYLDQYNVLFPEENSGHVSAIQKILESTSRAEKTELIQDMFPGENLPGGSYGLARLIAKNPAIGIPVALSSVVSRGVLVRMTEKPPLRDLFIKYDSIPSSELNTVGGEILKRIGEIMRGYLATEPTRAESRVRGEQIIRGDN